jgi:hypothetical protein
VASVAVVLGDGGPNADLQLGWTDRSQDPVRADFSELFAGNEPPDAAVDLLAIAVATYAADKAVLRGAAEDGWTRAIELHAPQLEPGRWPAPDIEQFLRHLTGDAWTFRPYGSDRLRDRVYASATKRDPQDQASSVALFSGGLDSFAHAASNDAPTVYVAHKDKSGLSPLQRDLAAGIGASTALRQFMLWVQRKDPITWEPEGSTRSRSFVFIAAALAVASALGVGRCVVPENGFISLNPPLIPGRWGTLSTRTTHPWTLHLLNELTRRGGLGVEVSNPFLTLTKGDITQLALDRGPTSLVFETISCSRARARARDRLHFGNCGYCYPCLVRRAGFLAAGVKDRGDYRADPRTDVALLGGSRADDFKAVVTGVVRPFTMRDLTAACRLPLGSDYDSLFEVIERSRLELSAMVEHKLRPAVRRAIGW